MACRCWKTWRKAGCEIRGDEAVRAVFPSAKPATEEDWKTEYLDAIIAVRRWMGWNRPSSISSIMAPITPTPS